MMYSAYKLTKEGDNMQPWCTPLEPVLTVASWPAYRFCQEAGQVVWYAHLFQNFPQFIVIHTVKNFGIVNKAEIGVFLELSFSMIQQMLAIWSLVPLPFLKPAWTSGSSWFMYCWSLAWKNFKHHFTSMWDECFIGLKSRWQQTAAESSWRESISLTFSF